MGSIDMLALDEKVEGPSLPPVSAFYTIKALVPERTSITTRAAALDATRKQSAIIPDLKGMMEARGWKAKQHPRVDDVRSVVDNLLKKMSKPEELQGLLNSDIGGWAAWWAPGADYDKVLWIGYYLVWLFLWDDRYEDAMVSNNYAAAEAQLKAALVYIPETMNGDVEPEDSEDMLMQFWKTHVSRPLRRSYDAEHLDTLVREISDYLMALQEEFKIVNTQELPTIQKYFGYRVGAISVKFLVVAGEFISGNYLPSSALNTASLTQLWASALEHIFIVNDILSGYKEIVAGDVSLLTLLVSHQGSLQKSVNTAVQAVQAATDHVEDAAVVMKQNVTDEGTLDRYIEAVRTCCVGNIMWSLSTKRYKLAPFKRTDGTIEILFDTLG
ncbi:hypothetical protein N0V90_011135 [Kalmusia sp. IMI 367209]|nr:hypothetical protein N0V90_011135 [Kalmusia sp. IMI 367209]